MPINHRDVSFAGDISYVACLRLEQTNSLEIGFGAEFHCPRRASHFRPQFTGPKIETSGDKPDLLIVDELGYLRFSRAGAESLFQAFAGR